MAEHVMGALEPGPDPCTDEALDFNHSPLVGGLEAVLQNTTFGWSRILVGEDQGEKLATLTADLRRPVSSIGEGKCITSGFLYLGTEPAIAWTSACRDHLSPMMKHSIESFEDRWDSVRDSLDGKPYHYVSLGPGDGQKDAVILQSLRRDNARLCYVPVDMSSEMLRLGVQTLTRQLKLSRSRILPVQLDFSTPRNVAELGRLLAGLFGDEPVLFSLLGNTMANFLNDTELLRMLTGQLLRPQDRFMLEVATTRRLDEVLAKESAREYENSRAFREFATSALMHFTDLQIDTNSLLFEGKVEDERALLMKVIYQNKTGRDIVMTLPDRSNVSFPRQDTIHLCISRKYAQEYLDSLLEESGAAKLSSSHLGLGGGHQNMQFGMELLVLTTESAATPPERPRAEQVWDF